MVSKRTKLRNDCQVALFERFLSMIVAIWRKYVSRQKLEDNNRPELCQITGIISGVGVPSVGWGGYVVAREAGLCFRAPTKQVLGDGDFSRCPGFTLLLRTVKWHKWDTIAHSYLKICTHILSMFSLWKKNILKRISSNIIWYLFTNCY